MNKGNLRITGNSTAAGGAYNNVQIVGEGTIDGDLQCDRFQCIGTLDMNGSLKAGRMRIVGTCSLTGEMDAQAAKLSGTLAVGGSAAIKEIHGAGAVEAQGPLHSNRIDLKGHLITKGDCEAEEFKVKGMFEVAGMLNAGVVDIKLYRDSTVQEMGGGKIKVHKASLLSPFSLFFKPSPDAEITASIIEGDDIELEYTKAKVVRGSRVTIGPGCVIELVEYKEYLEQKKGAIVKEHRRI